MNNTLTNAWNLNLLSCENIKRNVLPYYGIDFSSTVTQIKFKDTDKQRAIYRIDTDKGIYCLKKVYYPIDELLFVYSTMEWLYRNNIKVPRFMSTTDHGRFVEYEGMLFIMTNWINGDKCDFDNLQHLNAASRNLSRIHESTQEFMPILGSKYKEGFSDLGESLDKHREQLLENEKKAQKYDDYFSKIYIMSMTIPMSLASISSFIALSINTDNLSRAVCHNDYVGKNLIMKDEDIYVIDFDKCKYDYCALDIGYCLRRLLRRENTLWNTDLAINFIQQYEYGHTLTIDDYKYILAYLAFPQKYWKLSRDYYKNISKCNKKAFINLLNKAVVQDVPQKNFTYEFLQYVEDKFDTTLI